MHVTCFAVVLSLVKLHKAPVQFLIRFPKSTIIQRYLQFPTKKRCLVLNAVSFSFYTNPMVENSLSFFFSKQNIENGEVTALGFPLRFRNK